MFLKEYSNRKQQTDETQLKCYRQGKKYNKNFKKKQNTRHRNQENEQIQRACSYLIHLLINETKLY